MQMGGWTIEWLGVSTNKNAQPPAVTLLDGIKKVVSNKTAVRYIPGDSDSSIYAARNEAKKSDAVIVAVGEKPYAEGEGNSSTAELAENQAKLIRNLASAGKPVIVVLIAGRPLMMSQLLDSMSALVMAYLPGTEGGSAIADMLYSAGVADVVLTDSVGTIYRGRKERMNPEKEALAARTNRDCIKGGLAEAMKGRDLFVGVSQPNIVTQQMVRSMAKDPIVFALANPVSEISIPDAYAAGAAVAADGRMMNNALAYPGIFRGALDCGATMITKEMCLAAAQALTDIVPSGGFLPEMMDPATHQAVIDAVTRAAGPGTPLVK
jgi:hypothetical protein